MISRAYPFSRKLRERGRFGDADAFDRPFPDLCPEGARVRLADAMEIPVERVSVKATTEEGLGITGKGEGMTATAVCLLSLGE